MSGPERFDVLVIGGGPGGQKAAVQAAKAGRRVALVERERGVGGECVHRGTIPSKTLRESALDMARLHRSPDVFDFRLREGVEIQSLMRRMESVVEAHVAYMSAQLERNGVLRLHGQARFVSPHEVVVRDVRGASTRYVADVIVIATGSRPRVPDGIAVDHEHVLDSDSILSLIYLPQSLAVLGGGVIASEYASVFALLGVRVTLIDSAPRPLRFMDAELSERLLESFARHGGSYLGEQRVREVEWDGVCEAVTTLESGKRVRSEKVLVALGRAANLGGLGIEAAGLAVNERGVLPVDAAGRTAVPHIYAVGDVAGPPGLASSAMAQGRRAVCQALDLDPGPPPETIPVGIFTIPELASVGLSEEEAIRRHGGARVGRARFDEVARGQISGIQDGLVKLVADPEGRRLLGVHIVGEGAVELIHVGQMALLAGAPVDVFVENVFNFPTLAETYRIAALDIVNRRPRL